MVGMEGRVGPRAPEELSSLKAWLALEKFELVGVLDRMSEPELELGLDQASDPAYTERLMSGLKIHELSASRRERCVSARRRRRL
jgi:hypothetical protein